jgi:hypothetical protein
MVTTFLIVLVVLLLLPAKLSGLLCLVIASFVMAKLLS